MAKIVQLVENGEKKYLKTHVEAVDGLEEKLQSLGSGGDIESHIANKNNPHAVTAGQVGAYTKNEVDNKITTCENKFEYVIFAGTEAQWEDLSQTEKDKYIMRGVVK